MIANARLMNILRAPIISEKSNLLLEKNNTAVFKVLPDANKGEIKEAVEKLFNVDVIAVRTLNMQGKTRRTTHGVGKRSDWKKAYVTLAKGQTFDLAAQAEESK